MGCKQVGCGGGQRGVETASTRRLVWMSAQGGLGLSLVSWRGQEMVPVGGGEIMNWALGPAGMGTINLPKREGAALLAPYLRCLLGMLL